MSAVLTIVDGEKEKARYRCQPYEVFVLGRETMAHVARGFPADPYMSRRHVLFEVAGERCHVEDLGSRNGVYVNGARIGNAELRTGDQIKAGRTQLRFTVEAGRGGASPRRRPAGARADARSGPATASVAAPPASMTVLEGAGAPRTRAGFEIIEQVARGGLGVVYRARERNTRREVALKVMDASQELDEHARAHFVREMSILSDLHHPNIVRVFDVGSFAGETWISMEFVDGMNIEECVLTRGVLSISDALSIGIQLLRGLGHAHQRRFVHRDVKPANVLLSGAAGRYEAKLVDFGLAKSLQATGTTGLTITGDSKGSPWFIAPEQLEDAKSVDYRADLYSVAATLYYGLTGAWHLREDGKYKDFLAGALSGRYVPIGNRIRMPVGFARVIDAALERKPKNRPASAAAMDKMLMQTAKALYRR